MPSASLPFNEQQRLAALHSYHILDTATEEDYDDLTELAAAICGTPVALISFVDKDRQWFKSHKGLDATETERALSFCAHALLNPTEILEVGDAKQDARFKNNALVTGAPYISFYAGVPLVDPEGYALGSICVIDNQPKNLTDIQRAALRTLSKQLIKKLEARKQRYELLELQAVNNDLHAKSQLLLQETAGLNDWLTLAISAGKLGYTEVELETGAMRCNERFKNCFGRIADEDFTYQDLLVSILPKYRGDVKEKVDKANAENCLYQAEYEVKWPDGSIHWISANGLPRYNEQGKADRMVEIIADITERKLDEQRKSDFIGIVSHELRSPLTSLSGYVQLLGLKAKSGSDRVTEDLAVKAKKQVDRMNALIGGFLDAARINEGKIKLQSSCFDMGALMEEVKGEISTSVTTHQIIFNDVMNVMVEADAGKIEQVLINFIHNAVKYSPIGSTVNVSVTTVGYVVNISVQDEGMGISLKDQQYVFDRFYRAENEGMKAISGFGIGLYICREIVTLHNGRIGVKSNNGKGTTFWFELARAFPVKS